MENLNQIPTISSYAPDLYRGKGQSHEEYVKRFIAGYLLQWFCNNPENGVHSGMLMQVCRCQENGYYILFVEDDTAENILIEYLSGRISSSACEYVFHRSLTEGDAFVSFPLAWCSDIAIWYKMSSTAGRTVNIKGDPVLWRNASNVNISSTSGLEDKKAEALALFIRWLGRNYRGKRDRRFCKALETFIKINLRISFAGRYTEESLKNILSAYSIFNKFRACILYIKFHKFL